MESVLNVMSFPAAFAPVNLPVRPGEVRMRSSFFLPVVLFDDRPYEEVMDECS